MNSRGLFIVIEGSDGSGKATQFNLLKERLKATGYDVAVFDFPRYNKESSYFVRQYLGGAFGPPTAISPYTASLFYALDRYEAAKDINNALKQGKIVLANRFVGSNMAHQGAKFDDPVEQRGFFVWEDNLEFQLLHIPRPDVSYFLRVPADISQKLINERAAKTGGALDGHESDFKYLKKSLSTYDVLCRLFPKDFKAIECTKDNELLSVAEINNLIWERVKPMLPKEKQHPSHSVVVTLGQTENNSNSLDSGRPDELVHSFKNASMLLRLQLERSRYVSVRSGFTRWSESGYEFYTPQGLPKNIEGLYKNTMEHGIANTKRLQEKLTQYLESHLLGNNINHPYSTASLLLPLLPMAALSNFEVVINKKSIIPLTSGLLANDAQEIQWAAKQLYLAARQKWPEDFKEPLESKEGPESINNIIAKLAVERLPQEHSDTDRVKLLEARPRLEFDLLAESIYPFTNLSLEEIAEEVSNWPYLQKHQSLEQAATRPELLGKVRYKMDVISDQITINSIIKNGGIKDVQVQAFTPRYGFDLPQIIEDAQADDLYTECFDDSLKLYSLIQGAAREDAAPYSTLLGHRVRWQLNVDASGLRDIIKNASWNNQGLADDMLDKVAEVHPLLWEVILDIPVNPSKRHGNGKNRVKPSRQRPSQKGSKKNRH